MADEAGTPPPDVAPALRRTSLSAMQAVCAWLAPMFALFAPLEFLLSAPAVAPRLCLLDLGAAAAFAVSWIAYRRRMVPESWAHWYAGLTCGIPLPYLAGNLAVTHDPVQSSGWALWAMGISVLILSWPVLLTLLGLATAGWFILAARYATPATQGAWQQYVFVILSAMIIGSIAHGVRLKTIRNLELVRAEEARQRQELARTETDRREVDMVRELNRLKTQFMNTAAHELATPMTPILLQMRILAGARSSMTPTQQRSFEILERSLRRLGGLLDDILDSVRIEADRLPLQRRAIDLAELVHEAAEGYRAVASEAGLTLDIDSYGRALVQADAKRINQVLVNLLSNAVKFTPRGGRVAVRLRRDGPFARVEVSDTGPGLSDADRMAIFTPFTRLDHPGAKPGSGLGLFISRGLVEGHGGTMGCMSVGRGRGSTFWFTLPLEAVQAADATRTTGQGTAHAGPASGPHGNAQTMGLSAV